MLSPFPGMDPFLEDPIEWPDFHSSFINELRTHLAPAVSSNFVVRIEERVYITHQFDDPGFSYLIPDVVVTRGQLEPAPSHPGFLRIKQPVMFEELYEEEIHDTYIEIRDKRSRQVVTAIELLSPANKVKNSRGREQLIEKRKSLHRAGVHYLEIDLLRAGERKQEAVGRSDYLVLSLPGDGARWYVWYIDVRDPLPTIGVPLTPEYADVPLDLQAVFNETYDRAYYANSLDYTQTIPFPRLKPADEAWVQEQIVHWQNDKANI